MPETAKFASGHGLKAVTILFLFRSHARYADAWMAQRMESEGEATQLITLSDDGFDLAVGHYSLMLVDCWAPWCGPCVTMAPVIDELAAEYDGRVVFGKLNTDENPVTTERFGIMGIPTFLILQGGVEVERIVGAVPKQEIRNALDRHLA